MSNKTLEIGAFGCMHSGWDDNYYPEDLPEDWRLDFYSHHFNVLLMPFADWKQASEDDVEQWLSDVKTDFVFFLQLSQVPDQATIQQLQMIKGVLTERLAGLVWQGDSAVLQSDDIAVLQGIATVLIDSDDSANDKQMQCCWRDGRRVQSTILGIISAEQSTDTRAMRKLIEAFLQQGEDDSVLYLIFEGQPPLIKAMEDTRIIEQMLV